MVVVVFNLFIAEPVHGLADENHYIQHLITDTKIRVRAGVQSTGAKELDLHRANSI